VALNTDEVLAMANEPNDRERTRNDLRELAKLAKPASGAPSHGFATADSSGYVDLSAFSATDSSWVDRELARAKAGSPPLPKGPRPKGRAIDALSPESMSPVALESFLVTEDTARTRIPRRRRALYGVLALASVAGVGALAFIVSRHVPPGSPGKAATPVAAAAVAPPATDTSAAAVPAPPPALPAPAAPTDTAAASAGTTASAAQATSAKTEISASAKNKAPAPSHAHAAGPATAAPRPAAAAAAAKPVVIPPSRTQSSGDSLMDAIRSSVAKSK
jgi:hypothetical protein